MIRRQRLQIVWVIRRLCDRPAIDDRLCLTQYCVKAFFIHELFFQSGAQHLPYWPYQLLPCSSMMRRGRRIKYPFDFVLMEQVLKLWRVPVSNGRLQLTACSMKFVPLSERISSTWPCRAIKRQRAFMHKSVSNEEASSICTARTARQVNMTPYFFMRLLPHLTSNGPK